MLPHDMEYQTIFPTPVGLVKNLIGEEDRLALKDIVAKESEGTDLWTCDSYFFLRSTPCIQKLKKSILKKAIPFINHTLSVDVDPGFFNIEDENEIQVEHDPDIPQAGYRYWGWVTRQDNGAYIAPHEHVGNFTCVYYVHVPEADGLKNSIELLHPLHDTRYIYGPDRYVLKPENDSLIIFPGYLTHWVHPNAGGPRWSAGMDIQIIENRGETLTMDESSDL